MQPRLRVELRRRLDQLQLDIRFEMGSEILVLFGPSGAGKTQTLQAIAGLMTPDEGLICLNDTILFRRQSGSPAINLPPRRRRIGYVFQHNALFPHMTALDNVAFPLGNGAQARRRAYDLLERMHLAHLAWRKPHELSGGQQQRVAIARALATESPVILFDESFSALDQPVRDRLHADLRALQAERDLVVIYVTHNLNDAFAIGHRIAIVREGRIEQIGSLPEVCRYPINVRVAQLLGLTNIIRARVIRRDLEGVWLDWQGWQIAAALPAQPPTPGTVVTAFIRPEEIRLVYPDRPLHRFAGHNLLPGRIIERRPGWRLYYLQVAVGETALEIAHPYAAYADLETGLGCHVQIGFRPESVIIIPDGGTTEASAQVADHPSLCHRA
ncbi:ABC transporter ATP-binding protein [Chloroflexus sp.]|uniref:ABC transporter ATP-binding protein n=1 Tax=Chloroflexus sp. TaxID=1904827 RepID=UPI002602F844|nr:ABC transporter ATP-binding protein [uncultured Chloroflexus sp.]